MEVIIIGAGIGGLTTAVALHRIGIDVKVYERASQLSEVGAGISLWANALTALRAIDVEHHVSAVCQRATDLQFCVAGGHSVAGQYRLSDLEKRFGVETLVTMVHRSDLVEVLARNLPTDAVLFGHEFEALSEQDDKVEVRFRNGEIDRADLLIGADGIHSAVRTARFGQRALRFPGYTCWRGVCERPKELQLGQLAEFWGVGARFGITTLNSDRSYWWATANQQQGSKAKDEKQYLLATFASFKQPATELIDLTERDHILRNDIFDLAPNKSWSSRRIVLIGDAAHATTPNLGQGGCLAIEDAVVLAQHLQSGANLPSCLAQFAKARYRRTAQITHRSRQFGWLGQWSSPAACWLRDRCVAATMRSTGALLFPRYATFDVGSL